MVVCLGWLGVMMVGASKIELIAGLYLSLVVLRLDQWTSQEPNARRSTVEHLSVHTGEMVKAVPLPPRLLGAIGPDDWALGTQSSRFDFWTVEWSSSDSEWETEAVSALPTY